MRARSIAATALVALVLAGPLTARGSGAPSCERVATVGEWTGIVNPLPSQATAYAVDPRRPEFMYITDGRSIHATKDGGCTWGAILDLANAPTADLPLIGPAASIETLDVPESPSASGFVYAVVEEKAPNAGAVRMHVLKSENRGAVWTVSDSGLPATSGEVVDLAIAPSDPDIIYLFIKALPGAGGDDIYASTDGGSTWTKRSSDSVPTTGAAIDPTDADDLWSWGQGGLFHSTNGGRTREVETSVAVASLGDVFHGPQSPARIMAYEPETQTINMSRDGGQTWYRIGGARGFAISMTHANNVDDVVMSVHESVYAFKAPSYWIEISPPELYDTVGDIRFLSADRTTDPAIYGLSDTGIVKFTGLNTEVELLPFNLSDAANAGGVPKLSPPRTTLRIPAGRDRTVPYKLALPPKPTPLDVYFLVDTTESMQSSIDGLRAGMQQIIDELDETGVDVQFGVGQYKDYPIPGFGDPVAGDVAYERLKAIGPVDDDLTSALESLRATGGGDIPESQLTGLYQAATGEGQASFVPPGQDAGFRPGSLRTIINITDAAFHKGPEYPAPPFETVASALRNEHILQIGLAVFGPNGNKGALTDLSSMADMTGTLAPRGGVDCDDDGDIDIVFGGSLVCEIRDQTSSGVASLAPAIISTLRAVSEEVTIEVSTEGGRGIAEVAPQKFNTIDLRSVSELPFDITFSCPLAPVASHHEVAVKVAARGQDIASAMARVRCGPVAPAPPTTPIIAPIIAAIVQPPVIPPPQPPQQLPGQQPNPQAQGAVAHQKQHQPQMAFVHASRLVADLEEEYAMSAVRDEQSGPSPAFYAAGAAMALAFAMATRTRQRVVVARVRR